MKIENKLRGVEHSYQLNVERLLKCILYHTFNL